MQHVQSPYDPFSLPDQVPLGVVAGQRRPRILSTPLHPLTWSKSGAGHGSTAPVTADGILGKRAANGIVANKEESEHERKRVQSGNDAEMVNGAQGTELLRGEKTGIFGTPLLLDDRIRYLVSFMLQHVTSASVEVEAKLGLIISKASNGRASETFPALCESPLRQEVGRNYRFESAVSAGVFHCLNEVLNRRVMETSELKEGAVKYLRARQCDRSYPGDIRETFDITRDESSGQQMYVLRSVQTKRRLGNINMICPLYPVDVRYSASTEVDCSLPPNLNPFMTREKDRLSYKFDCLSVDITTVHVFDGTKEQAEAVHEVEIEIDPDANVFAEVEKYKKGQPDSKLFDMAATLVHTTRLLSEEVKMYVERGSQR